MLQVAAESEECPEQGDCPEVAEHEPGGGVDAEDLDTGEPGHGGAHGEAEDVGELGDGQGDGGIGVCHGHPGHEVPGHRLGPRPRGQEEEDAVHPNSNQEDDHHHVDRLPGITKIQTQSKSCKTNLSHGT